MPGNKRPPAKRVALIYGQRPLIKWARQRLRFKFVIPAQSAEFKQTNRIVHLMCM